MAITSIGLNAKKIIKHNKKKIYNRGKHQGIVPYACRDRLSTIKQTSIKIIEQKHIQLSHIKRG